MKFYVNLILITMPSRLCFRRRIQNHGGYYFVSVPPAVARFLNCSEVDLVVKDGTIVMNPVREDNENRNEKINYEK